MAHNWQARVQTSSATQWQKVPQPHGAHILSLPYREFRDCIPALWFGELGHGHLWGKGQGTS